VAFGMWHVACGTWHVEYGMRHAECDLSATPFLSSVRVPHSAFRVCTCRILLQSEPLDFAPPFLRMYTSTCMPVRHRSVVYHSVIPESAIQNFHFLCLHRRRMPAPAKSRRSLPRKPAISEDLQYSQPALASQGRRPCGAGCEYCRSSDIAGFLGSDRLLLAGAGIRRRWRQRK
jgi:hypothetical protein